MTAALQDRTEPVLEAQLAGGIRLYGAHHLLVRATRVPTRPLEGIERIYVHHSGALGRAGLAGLQASARYSVGKLEWPSVAYHYWIPAEPVYDDDGELVVYRAAPDEWRTYHTGGRANAHGLGVVLQGNTTAAPLSQTQIDCLQALLPWLRERHGLGWTDPGWLSWHSDSKRFGGSGKPSCPGKHAQEWLEAYRARSV